LTIDEFLKKYNKCPFCVNYVHQENCDQCVHWLPIDRGVSKDLFRPTSAWTELMNREVSE